MPVYIDDMYLYPMGAFRGMKMSHMMADTREELIGMANSINLDARWIQNDGQGRSRRHFDVSMAYREKAIENGAIPVTMRQMGVIAKNWREKDSLQCKKTTK